MSRAPAAIRARAPAMDDSCAPGIRNASSLRAACGALTAHRTSVTPACTSRAA